MDTRDTTRRNRPHQCVRVNFSGYTAEGVAVTFFLARREVTWMLTMVNGPRRWEDMMIEISMFRNGCRLDSFMDSVIVVTDSAREQRS
jgi:hypothetical protein